MKNPAFERVTLDHHENKQINPFQKFTGWCVSVAKGLSIHACRFGIEGSGTVGLEQVLAKFLRENYHPKLSNFGRSYFFTALLAKIDTHIRSYLNPSIMKVN